MCQEHDSSYTAFGVETEVQKAGLPEHLAAHSGAQVAGPAAVNMLVVAVPARQMSYAAMFAEVVPCSLGEWVGHRIGES